MFTFLPVTLSSRPVGSLSFFGSRRLETLTCKTALFFSLDAVEPHYMLFSSQTKWMQAHLETISKNYMQVSKCKIAPHSDLYVIKFVR
jgi:hypothetical protein